MQTIKLICIAGLILINSGCTRTIYESNGETIYRTGRNTAGEKLLDKSASRIKIVQSCSTCHGKNGTAMKNISIQYSYLSDTTHFMVPYTDSLIYRFLDEDLRSDGSKADIGVIWKMSDKDKQDLINYLKTL